MRTYKINSKLHHVYEDESELPFPKEEVIEDWRLGQVNDWVRTDDGCILQILRRRSLRPHRKSAKHAREYVGTCTGTFLVTDENTMDAEKRHNIYSFGGAKTSSKQLFDRKNLNGREELFALFISQGISPIEAYTRAYETNKLRYAEQKAALLLKTTRIKKAVKENLKPILAALDINEEFVLKGIREVAIAARNDGERLKALIKLGEILDIEDKGSKQESMAMVGFKGFKPEQIEAVEKVMELGE